MERMRDSTISREPAPPAGPVADITRIVWGLFFLGAAVFNAVVTIPSARGVLRAFADLSWPGAAGLVRGVLLPYAGTVIGLVVVFEAVVGGMILSRGAVARRGLWAATGWLLLLVPFLGVYAIANVVLAVSMLPLLSRLYQRSLHGVLGRRPVASRWTVFGLEVFVGANAIFGGVALIRDGFGMPLSWLERTWFDSWVIPGILLLTIVAFPMLGAAWAMLRRRARAPQAAVAVGGLLVGWIIGQMTMVRYFFLQPILLLFGLAIAGLGVLLLTTKRQEAVPAARRSFGTNLKGTTPAVP